MVTGISDRANFELVLLLDGWLRRVPLGQAPVVLGRAEDCDVQLADPRLSRRHCRLSPTDDGGWLLEDLGSQAGTLLDGVPLRKPALVRPGARALLGSIQMRLEQRPAGALLSGEAARDDRNVSLLLETIAELYGTTKFETLLRTIVVRAIRLAGADRGALLLRGDSGELEAAVACNAEGHDLSPQQVLTHTIPDRVLESGRASVLADTEASGAPVPQSVLSSALRSVLCVPIPGHGGPAGVLYVDGRRPAEEFGPPELAVFEALAVHGALALERERLRESQSLRERGERRRLEQENAVLRTQLGAGAPLGDSEPMRRALDLVRRVATSEASILLTGETGAGKEVLARYLHQLSPRAAGPFVVVDCGAIPEGLIESELFGHEKGAFTGALAAREGRFREAHGGTVFLDEIGELPLLMQTRLLRVLQERTVQPVGGAGPVAVDVRVVCATHRDLMRHVAEGRFRQDLYYRIAVLPIPVPPLRDRGRDILLLARHFLGRIAAASGTSLSGFTREAADALLAHPWPGNVRELENRVQRAALLARPPYATRADLGLGEDPDAEVVAPSEADLPYPTLQQSRAEASDRLERAYLDETLRRTAGNVSQAAKLAGVSRQQLQRLMREHRVHRLRYAGSESAPDELDDNAES